MKRLLRLFRRQPAPDYRVGDMVRFRGRPMAVSRRTDSAAELIWIDEDQQLHTAGFVPLCKIERTAQ